MCMEVGVGGNSSSSGRAVGNVVVLVWFGVSEAIVSCLGQFMKMKSHHRIFFPF